ncbi:MAG: YIP1 family protein [Candidatus Obscuribacterales bacterium]|nr:YIP1 family protein [Candidatus Obscuribacterales bacterium]
MTDPNSLPNNHDEERQSVPTTPDFGPPLMSNAAELGVAPEEFFQVSIDVPPPQQTSDLMVTGGQQPEYRSSQYTGEDEQVPPVNGSSMPPSGEVMATALPSASRGPNDFFDQSGRIAQPGNHTSQAQALPPEERQESKGYSFSTFLDGPQAQPKQSRSNDPYAFFDSASESTASGATPGPTGAGSSQSHPNVLGGGGLTAEQAFFFGGDSPIDQPNRAFQKDSTFQSFYQTNSPQGPGPEAQLPAQEVQTQQPDGWGPAHLPSTHQFDHSNQQINPNIQPAVEPPPPPPPLTNRLNLIEDRPKIEGNAPPSNKTRPEEASPKPKRRRFSEPDRGDDFTKATEPQQFPSLDKLITPETRGTLMFAMYQIREILQSPNEFFNAMPLRGNIAEPAIFMVICAVGSGLLAGFINFNLLITLQFAIGAIISAVMLSFSAWKCYGMMGSQEPFEANFRVIAYSQAALIIAGIQLNFLGTPIPGYLTLFISIVLSMRLQLIGMAAVHQDLQTNKLFPVLILTTVFIMVIRIRLGLI